MFKFNDNQERTIIFKFKLAELDSTKVHQTEHSLNINKVKDSPYFKTLVEFHNRTHNDSNNQKEIMVDWSSYNPEAVNSYIYFKNMNHYQAGNLGKTFDEFRLGIECLDSEFVQILIVNLKCRLMFCDSDLIHIFQFLF